MNPLLDEYVNNLWNQTVSGIKTLDARETGICFNTDMLETELIT